MKISTVVEKDGGLYQFTAELSQEQHQFLLEYAIRALIHRGLMPFNVGEPPAEGEETQAYAHLPDEDTQH